MPNIFYHVVLSIFVKYYVKIFNTTGKAVPWLIPKLCFFSYLGLANINMFNPFSLFNVLKNFF